MDVIDAPAGFGAARAWCIAVRLGIRRVHDRGFAGARGLAGLVAAAAVAVLLAACSPGADYPAILDRPAPREQTLTQQQVQQATDALKTDRDQLNSQAQAAQAQAVASGMAAPPATTGTTPSAGAPRKP